EVGTDTRACDAGEAATGATANDGVAVVGSDCTTACRDRDLVRRRSQDRAEEQDHPPLGQMHVTLDPADAYSPLTTTAFRFSGPHSIMPNALSRVATRCRIRLS